VTNASSGDGTVAATYANAVVAATVPITAPAVAVALPSEVRRDICCISCGLMVLVVESRAEAGG
jgi:hypothetical protein